MSLVLDGCQGTAMSTTDDYGRASATSDDLALAAEVTITKSPDPSTQTSELPHSTFMNLEISSSNLNAGRDINNVVINEATPTLHRLRDDLKPVAAAYDSSTSSANRRASCFEGTRVQILGEIDEWIHGQDPSQASIYVLDGVAGIGKSTIAQTVAQRAAEEGILGASFFCSRDEDERNTGKHFFSTIAYHLACHSSEFRDGIVEAVKSDPDIKQKDLNVQFAVLILNALQTIPLSAEQRTLIVIDALDECDQEDAKSILRLLGQHTPSLPHLRFFITSRPEFHITDILDHDTIHERFRLHDIETSIVESDIRLYLDYALSAEQVTRAFPHLQPPWQPTDDEKQMLYGICGTLFIVAATATKFILDNKRQGPMRQLAYLLEGVSSTDYSGARRMDVLDRTYVQILRLASSGSSSVDSDSQENSWWYQYQTVVGAIIVLQNPLPRRCLAALLSVSESYIEGTLLHLHSMVAPSGDDSERIFRVHHKSFPDFIASRERIQKALEGIGLADGELPMAIAELHIDLGAQHRNMTRQCFKYMHKALKQNMCELSPADWYRDRADIEHLFRNHPISPAVSYACLHWVLHLCGAGLDRELEQCLWDWASRDILSWLETLSIINQIDASHDILEKASSLIPCNKPVTALQRTKEYITMQFRHLRTVSPVSTRSSTKQENDEIGIVLRDTSRFIQSNAMLFKLSPMHIYGSGISFAPMKTAINKLYKSQANLRLISGAGRKWSPAWAVLSGHSGGVTSIAFSPDGSRMASSSQDNTVQLWDPKSGSHLTTLKGHSQGVTCIQFSPDGSRLASGSEDNTVRLWDARSGSHLTPLKGHSQGVTCIQFLPDGSRLASGSEDNTVRLWDAKSGSHLTTLKGHSQGVTCIHFLLDGSRLASGSGDNTVRLLDAKSGSHLTPLKGHSQGVTCIQFLPDGSRLASGSWDNTVRVWDAKSGSHLTTLKGHSDTVTCIQFLPDGSRLASGSGDNTVRVWDAKSGSHLTTLKGHSQGVTCIQFLPDGSRLASGSWDNTVRVWDAKSGSHLTTLKGHSDTVTCIQFLPDGSRLASGSWDNTVRVWDAKSGSHPTTLKGHSQGVTCIQFSPDGSRLASASWDDTVRVWDTKSGSHLTTLKGHSMRVACIQFSPDGSRLASGSGDNTVRLWDAKSGSHLTTLKGHSGDVTCIEFSPDGSRLASGSEDNTVRLWDAKSGSHLTTLKGHSGDVTCIEFSPDGSRLASGSEDNTVRLWDAKSGSHLTTLNGHSGGVICIDFLPDGSRLASGSRDNTVRVWDAKSGSHLFIRGYRYDVHKFAFFTSYCTTSPCQMVADAHIFPTRLLLLIKRSEPPYFYGIAISADIQFYNSGPLDIVPICWFPADVEPTEFAVNPSRSLVSVGCTNGRVLILDISSVALP